MSLETVSDVKLTIVVVSVNRPIVLEGCLDSIDGQVHRLPNGKFVLNATGHKVEIVIVRRDYNDPNGAVPRDEVEARVRFPFFRWFEAPAYATIPQMRSLGAENSTGEIVALIEDDCIASERWGEYLLNGHNAGYNAVGGTVLPSQYRNGLDWAVFFCDYARFMPPYGGVVHALPGNNFSYKRKTLTSLNESVTFPEELYEVFVNAQLEKRGEKLFASPDAPVMNVNSWDLRFATAVPFHHGRGYAAMRFPANDYGKRLAYSAATVLLPGLQSLRICREVLARKGYAIPLLAALPSIVLYWTCWSIGECMGYLLGSGDSLQHWR